MMILIDRRIVNNNNKLVIMITEKWAKFYMHLVCYSHSAAAQRHSFFLKKDFFSSSMMMRESLIFFLSLNGRCLFFFLSYTQWHSMPFTFLAIFPSRCISSMWVQLQLPSKVVSWFCQLFVYFCQLFVLIWLK